MDAEPEPEGHTIPYVIGECGTKSLHFSFSAVQSRMDLHRPERLMLSYTRIMMGCLLFNARPKALAMIGLGGGSLARFIYHELPQASLQVVEINPEVLELRREFLLPDDSARLTVQLADGADFVHSAPGLFDTLLVDGFDIQGQPPELATLDFYRGCASCLTPQGLLVANLCPSYAGFARQLEDLRHVFGSHVVEVDDASNGNTVVFASKGSLRAQFARHGWRCRWHLAAKAYADLLPELSKVAAALNARTVGRAVAR